ncbi:MAG: aldose epimerase family protein [Fusobacteriaceae bacterium]
MILKISEFGKSVHGDEVLLYNFKNESLDIEIISYGGIIKSLKTADKSGKFENIVLGYETLSEYESCQYYFGAITGRVAGRVKEGVLKIGDEVYRLEKNNGGNNLHGGLDGLNTKVWKGEAKVVGEKGILTLTYKSPHLESGFPGEVDFKVEYTIEGESLKIDYTGISDRPTYINLTNHSYFNLSGDAKRDIKDSLLKVNALAYASVDEGTLPIKLQSKADFLEFNTFEKLGDILKRDSSQLQIVGGGIDHPFQMSKEFEFDIEFKDEISGRGMRVKSNEPVAVIYTGNYLEKKHNGICFEMQDYPDVINFLPEKAKIYNKNLAYNTKTIFIFN